jgi:hypothetical protein
MERKMQVSSTIDWLSFTQKGMSREELPFIPDFHDKHQKFPTTPRFGYLKAKECECGLVVYFGDKSERMGAHFVYSGASLRILIGEGVHPTEVNDYHRFLGHVCTRLDLALDVRDCAEINQFIEEEVRRNRWSGTARSANIVKSTTSEAQTVYVGSRQSETFLRMYNKAAEQRVRGDWTRLEVELKRRSAERYSQHLAGQSALAVGELAKFLIDRQCHLDGSLWETLLRTPLQAVSVPQVRTPDRAKWLIETCAPSLGRELQKPGKQDLWRQFVVAVAVAANKDPDILLDKLNLIPF